MGISAATLATISTAAAAGSAVIGAVGAYRQGEAQAQQARYQAAVARNNQIIAQQNAQLAKQQGAVKEQMEREKTAQTLGKQRAALAASGVTLDSGSPLRLQEDTARLGETDALTIRNNAARQAYGFQSQASDYGAQAGVDESSAENASTAGMFGVASSLIGGASSVSEKWAMYKTGYKPSLSDPSSSSPPADKYKTGWPFTTEGKNPYE